MDDSEIYIIETKGLLDLDVPLKTERLSEWCKDVNAKNTGITYHWLFVKDDEFREKIPRSFQELIKRFYKPYNLFCETAYSLRKDDRYFLFDIFRRL